MLIFFTLTQVKAPALLRIQRHDEIVRVIGGNHDDQAIA
jgi:hypothetical protein